LRERERERRERNRDRERERESDCKVKFTSYNPSKFNIQSAKILLLPSKYKIIFITL